MLLGAAVARLLGRSLLWLIPVVGVPFLYRYFERIRYGEVLDSLIGAGPVEIVVVVVAAWLGRVITSALTQPTGQSAN